MSEEVWLILVLWIGLLAFSRRNQIIGGFAGMMGIIFGLMLISVIPSMGIVFGTLMIGLNLYVMFDAIFVEKK